MTLIEDDRNKNDFFSRLFRRTKVHIPFDPKSEDNACDDETVIKLQKKDPLEKEESVEDDMCGND